MRTSSRLGSAVAPLLLVFAADVPALAQTSPGWMYTMNMTTDSGGTKRSSMAMKYQVTDRRLRLEFVQVSGIPAADAAEGMSQILDDRDSSMTMVMPGQQMAMVVYLNDFFGSAPGMLAKMAPKVERHLTSSHTEDLGVGERILGHATHRYRVASKGTIEIAVGGRACTRTIDSVDELWMATDVDLLPVMQSMLKHYESVMDVKGIAGDATVVNRALPPGTAMRTISRTTAVDATGKAVPVTTTMEYVEMSQAPIAASVFEVPAGYQKMDMRKMMADMPAGAMDSAMAHSPDNKAAENALCRSGTP